MLGKGAGRSDKGAQKRIKKRISRMRQMICYSWIEVDVCSEADRIRRLQESHLSGNDPEWERVKA